ncbi:MAG: hypothetical protein ACC645_03335 [Pirellulales bacterium]
MYSADALHWFQAGFVAFTPKLLECFSYSWLMIDGDDIKYWRDVNGVHHVPKRPLTDLLFQ